MGVSLKLAALLLFASLSVCSGSTPAGEAFLATKATEDGVITHSSGLMYKVLADGPADGKRPLVSTPCECHYKGTTITGEEFDSSYSRGVPTTFAPNQVIKGWTIAMQLMKEGDKWELYIPSELAYGDSQRGQFITPGSVLVFTLELLTVKGPSQPPEAVQELR